MRHLIWLSPIIYFSISWGFPWDKVQWDSTISISYLFDIIFVTISCIFFKNFFEFKKIDFKGGISRIIAVLILAIVSLLITSLSGIKSPFGYIEHLVLQILILAPIIEELVFRQAIFIAFSNYFKNKNILLLSNSIFFSLSHLPALFILPEEFKSFIFIQLVYTFFLGWICTKARLKNGNIAESVILHFLFNLVFYFAVVGQII